MEIETEIVPGKTRVGLECGTLLSSLRAYRPGVAHPDWLGDVILPALPKPQRW